MVDDVSKIDYDAFSGPLDPPPRSELAVPLIYEDRPVGVIALESRRLRAFNESQARLLENIANHLSIALVNARLHAEHVERERRLEHEVLLARDVQRAMIPEKIPPMKGFEIAARLEPALNRAETSEPSESLTIVWDHDWRCPDSRGHGNGGSEKHSEERGAARSWTGTHIARCQPSYSS
jgi:hypothetical protein